MKLPSLLILAVGFAASIFAKTEPLSPPPRELIEAWKLPAFYQKHVSIEGLPVLGSAKASDYALNEAAFLIRKMVGDRPEILRAMAKQRVRFAVMAPTEMTTDIPEHSDLQPRTYWNRRARGLGASKSRPAVSCGEENLIELLGDPYATENILIHEFAHAIHQMGLNAVDPTFDRRLNTAYESAKAKGLWKGTYAMQNRAEYWAEAAQSWFDCNRANDREHGPIDTREKLKAYDTEVSKLCVEVFGDGSWRYQKPSKRAAVDRAHLAGFDSAKAKRFEWPKEALELDVQGEPIAWLEPAKTPANSPRSGAKTTINFVNRRAHSVSIDWLDFDGKRQRFAELRSSLTHLQNTYAGHVWIVSEGDTVLGAAVPSEGAGRLEITEPIRAAKFQLTAPLEYQVIQRDSKNRGRISITGKLPEAAGKSTVIEARIISGNKSGDWQRLKTEFDGADFRAAMEAPAGGWYRLEVRAASGDKIFAESSVAHVGIGEVFVVAGQSNSANHGEEKQQPQTGRVAAFDGKSWRLANDPQPGASGGGGSFLPPLGDALATRFDVPVGFIACGIGATSVREWLPKGATFPNPPTIESRVRRLPSGEWESKGEAFEMFAARMKLPGARGFRAVLWHQGESDANQRDTTRTLSGKLYREYLETVIRHSRREIGWEPQWFIAQVSYHVPGDESSPDIRAAQALLWKDGVALEGPDSDALKGDLRERGGQGVHFSGKGLRAHAARWSEKITPWLEQQLKERP